MWAVDLVRAVVVVRVFYELRAASYELRVETSNGIAVVVMRRRTPHPFAKCAKGWATQQRLVHVLDDATAAAVDAVGASAPCEKKGDEMDEEPETEALVFVDPEEDQDAGDEERDDDRDNADDGWNVGRHAVLKPCEDHANARQKEREDEKPERDRVDVQRQGSVHGSLSCYLTSKDEMRSEARNLDAVKTISWRR